MTDFGVMSWMSRVCSAHEMVFGYGLAVVAGFLLTAVPNWTELPTVRGRALGCLFILWLTARVACGSTARA